MVPVASPKKKKRKTGRLHPRAARPVTTPATQTKATALAEVALGPATVATPATAEVTEPAVLPAEETLAASVITTAEEALVRPDRAEKLRTLMVVNACQKTGRVGAPVQLAVPTDGAIRRVGRRRVVRG